MPAALDPFDLKLLARLQDDARQSQAELGAQIGLSSAAVNRRIKRLADDGVIDKFSVVLDPSAVGVELTVIAQVEVESERVDLLDAMKRSFSACPQVQQCYYVAGEWDFVLIFAVQNMSQYTELTRALFFQNNNVKLQDAGGDGPREGGAGPTAAVVGHPSPRQRSRLISQAGAMVHSGASGIPAWFPYPFRYRALQFFAAIYNIDPYKKLTQKAISFHKFAF